MSEKLGAPEIEVIPGTSAALARHVPTPADLLQLAVQQDLDVDKLEKLLQLQREWEKDQARKAFSAAMAAFKTEAIHISKDKPNAQYGSRYTSIGNLVETVTPFLGQHGLSAAWDVDQSNGIVVTCTITHSMGHSQSVSMQVPPDKSGSKNPIQEIKSAITYARCCTFECATGLATRDEAVNPDDDGNGAGPSSFNVREHCEWIANAKDPAELSKLYENAKKAALEARNSPALRTIAAAKDKRKAEF